MTPIRYMWSAIDSGPCTPRLTHPSLLVVCTHNPVPSRPVKPRHDKRNRPKCGIRVTHLEAVAEREEVDGGGRRSAGVARRGGDGWGLGRGGGGGHAGGEAEREDAVGGREEGERGPRGGEGGGAEGGEGKGSAPTTHRF
jgi:hypothetical protein